MLNQPESNWYYYRIGIYRKTHQNHIPVTRNTQKAAILQAGSNEYHSYGTATDVMKEHDEKLYSFIVTYVPRAKWPSIEKKMHLKSSPRPSVVEPALPCYTWFQALSQQEKQYVFLLKTNGYI